MSKRDLKIDKEEAAILASFNKGEWKKSKKTKTITIEAKAAASEFLKKDARINVRISSMDLDLIKQIAVREGLAYQSLITSVLHKFANSY